jgi:DNA-binding transcriptional regulator YiaG
MGIDHARSQRNVPTLLNKPVSSGRPLGGITRSRERIPGRKASVAHRASIAELRRQANALEKELRHVAKGASRPAAAPASDDEGAAGTKRRFSATRLAAHRAKLELSAASYGQLVGVSGQTIYHWEQGKARPRAAQLENLAAVRDLGAREVVERLSRESH